MISKQDVKYYLHILNRLLTVSEVDYYRVSYRSNLFGCLVVVLYSNVLYYFTNYSNWLLPVIFFNIFLLYKINLTIGHRFQTYNQTLNSKLIFISVCLGIINGLFTGYHITPQNNLVNGDFYVKYVGVDKNIAVLKHSKLVKKLTIITQCNVAQKKIMESTDRIQTTIRIKNKTSRSNKGNTYYGIINSNITPLKPSYSRIVREFLYKRIKSNFGKNYEIIAALLIGKKNENTRKHDLYKLGLGHLTSVSGLHMNQIFWFVFILVRTVLLPWPIFAHYCAYILGFMALLLMTLISSFSPSAIRASIMYFILLSFKILNLNYNRFLCWCFTYVLMTLVDGTLISDLSFLMSFFAILAIHISGSIPLRQSFLTKLIIRQLTISSFILPITAIFFNQTNLFSIIWNILFLNVFAYIILFSFLGCFVKPIALLINYVFDIISLIFSQLCEYTMVINFGKMYYQPILVLQILLLLLSLYTYINVNLRNLIYINCFIIVMQILLPIILFSS